MAMRGRDIADILETLDVPAWADPIHTNMAGSAIAAVETGKVLYFPRLAFDLPEDERPFLSPAIADARAKNITFDPNTGALKHAVGSAADRSAIAEMMRRYCQHAQRLVRMLLPQYEGSLEIGRTSFRPAEISGRRLSSKKDDTRLHIDAFPSTPTGGKRILRVFTNVNPTGEGRLWRLGASFENVAHTFLNRVPRYSPGGAKMMRALGATKAYRTRYDHLMLNMHDAMKADDEFQRYAEQNAFSFPPGSTWIAYTDKVSHAAMSGQYLFEQTFYLPLAAMVDPSKAPLRILECLTGRTLI